MHHCHIVDAGNEAHTRFIVKIGPRLFLQNLQVA